MVHRSPMSHLRFSTNLNNGSAVGGMPVDAIIPGATEVLEQICRIVISHRRRQGNRDGHAGKFRVAVGCVRSQNATAQRRREHFCNFRIMTRGINETVYFAFRENESFVYAVTNPARTAVKPQQRWKQTDLLKTGIPWCRQIGWSRERRWRGTCRWAELLPLLLHRSGNPTLEEKATGQRCGWMQEEQDATAEIPPKKKPSIMEGSHRRVQHS